jgi:hypothetical protein
MWKVRNVTAADFIPVRRQHAPSCFRLSALTEVLGLAIERNDALKRNATVHVA